MNIMDYIDELTGAFSFDDKYYTTNYFIERDANSYFALFFLCNNLLGLQKAVETKWALDEENGRGFHLPKKDDTQLSMFEDWDKQEKARTRCEYLRLKLLAYLTQRRRSNYELYEYVLRLGYLPKHANEVLRELQSNNIISVTRTDQKKAPKGAFYLAYSKDKLNPTAYISLV